MSSDIRFWPRRASFHCRLTRWFIPLLHRLPRQHRHGIGDRLITNLNELLEQLALARFQRDRCRSSNPCAGAFS